jgi:hypothetical protein
MEVTQNILCAQATTRRRQYESKSMEEIQCLFIDSLRGFWYKYSSLGNYLYPVTYLSVSREFVQKPIFLKCLNMSPFA